MGLNDIRLSPSTLAALYSTSLVDGDQPEQLVHLAREPAAHDHATNEIATATPETKPGFRFLGNNKKRILIAVACQGKAYLPDDDLAFLTKMLTACKLGLDDVAIVNTSHYPGTAAPEYLARFNSEVVFLFGPDPAAFGLPMAFPQFQVQSYAGTTFLYTPPLGQMSGDELLKSKLWLSLKRIFSI